MLSKCELRWVVWILEDHTTQLYLNLLILDTFATSWTSFSKMKRCVKSQVQPSSNSENSAVQMLAGAVFQNPGEPPWLPILIGCTYWPFIYSVGDEWNKESIDDFEKLSFCAQWVSLMARVVKYDGDIPCLELIDTTGQTVRNHGYCSYFFPVLSLRPLSLQIHL